MSSIKYVILAVALIFAFGHMAYAAWNHHGVNHQLTYKNNGDYTCLPPVCST